MVDPHVHLRDWSQAAKETVRHGLAVAWRVGLSAVFEMPNTDPALTSRRTIAQRIAHVERMREYIARDEPGSEAIVHGLYAGLTADEAQIEEIVAVHAEHFPRVVGFKLFAGHSTGRMGVVTREEQAAVWRRLALCDYRGVVAVHAESEELLRPDLWDPARPESHALARPPEAELHSVRQQVALAGEAGYRGSIHICHVSTPEALTYIASVRDGGATPFRLRGAVTPHHLLLSQDVAAQSPVPAWNVNPPLRDPARRRRLWELTLAGAADWLETDHAPHTWNDKIGGASGLPGLPAFRLAAERLRDGGVDASRMERLTHTAVLEAFGIDPARIPPNPQAAAGWDYGGLAAEYPWDPYKGLLPAAAPGLT